MRIVHGWLRCALSAGMVLALGLPVVQGAQGADRFDAALAHPGRSPADLTRDGLDHPADLLRLAGIKPGMQVADVLAGDGYYSEILSYLVGPTGHVLLMNNEAFDYFSDPDLGNRLAGNRLTNVTHETLDLNDMHLPASSFDAILLVKVYHDLYWIDPTGKWPKIDVGRVLDQLHAALKAGGTLVVVDHSAKAGHGKDDAGTLHRIEEAFAIKDFKAHGFRVVAKSNLLRKPDDARDQISYKGPMVGKTDRFALIFRKS